MKLSSNLAALAEALNATMAGVEPRFIELGAKLQSLYSEARDLGQLSTEVCGLIEGDSDQGILTNIRIAARRSVEELQSCQSEISKSLLEVEASTEHLGKLYRMCEVIKKTAKTLGVIGLNIAVESERSVEFSGMFAVFVKEIKELARKVDAISQSIRGDAVTARSKQLAAINEISEGLDLLRGLTQQAEEAVGISAREIEWFMNLTRQRMAESAARSLEISRQVGDIVVAIQFHDIARQQVEHIIAALRQAEKVFDDESSSANPDEEFKRGLNRVHSMLHLQAAQLRQVVLEIDAAHEKSMEAFNYIRKEVSGLLTETPHFSCGNLKKIEAENAFDKMKSSLGRLYPLLSQGYDLGSRMQKTAEEVSDAASGLSRHVAQVRDISTDLHLKALNAIVMTLHLGEKGRTFGVLAREVKELSNEANGFVEEVVVILESITSLARGLGGEERQDIETSLGDQSESIHSLDEGLQAISSARERLPNDFGEALQRADSLEKFILQAKEDLGFLSEMSLELDGHLKLLDETVQLLSPWSDGNLKLTQEEDDAVISSYTMQKEREVHDLIAGGTRDFLVQEQEKALEFCPRCADEDDMGDNVELF